MISLGSTPNSMSFCFDSVSYTMKPLIYPGGNSSLTNNSASFLRFKSRSASLFQYFVYTSENLMISSTFAKFSFAYIYVSENSTHDHP